MRSLAALLDGDPDDVLVYRDGQATTRGELQAIAADVAHRITVLGFNRNAIGVQLSNTANAIASWFGIWQAEAVLVPLNPRVPRPELVAAAEATGMVGAIWGDDRPPAVQYVDPMERGVYTEADAIIQYTSGTTGRPKAVVLRHDTISDLLDSVIGTLRGNRTAQARMPNIVPMSLALWAGIYQVLFAFKLGVPVVLMDHFETGEFARLVAEYEIKSSVLPPAALVMLCNDPAIESLAPLRYVRSVSAPLSPSWARRFHERFGIAILNGYGQTELGGEAVGWSAADWKEYGLTKLGSVGRPHAAFRVRVRDADGALAPVGEVGELEIASTAALPPADAAMEGRVTDDGWLRTGDLAHVDADGFVWIEGRVSDMINRGGLKVYPDEVEEAFRAHPAVADIAVAGVADERLGEVPWAFVVTAPGPMLDPDELRTWARDLIAPYKIPAGFTVVDALPRNEIGKVLRRELVARQTET